jgi:hypothetical protein
VTDKNLVEVQPTLYYNKRGKMVGYFIKVANHFFIIKIKNGKYSVFDDKETLLLSGIENFEVSVNLLLEDMKNDPEFYKGVINEPIG